MLLKKADGTVVCARCEVAERPLKRMRGLLGRSSLGQDEGMLFRPAGSIHMFFMRFPIDAVFCDRDLRVVGVVSGLKPWRMAGRRGAKAVVELAAGSAAGIRPGDQLTLEARSRAPPTRPSFQGFADSARKKTSQSPLSFIANESDD